MILHSITAAVLAFAIFFSFMALGATLQYFLREVVNKYPNWVVAASVMWAVFYMLL